MESFILCILALVVLIFAWSIATIFRMIKSKNRPIAAIADPNRPQQRVPIIVGGRRQTAVRRRPVSNVGATSSGATRFRHFEDSSDEADVASFVNDDSVFTDGKIGKKKLAKLQAKAEKQAQREAELEEREERKRLDAQRAELRKKQEEKEKQEDVAREEAERKAREEKERKEHEEYLIMKEAFAVEDEGFDLNELDESENMLQQFVNFIKTTKVVSMDELAAHWKLRPQDVVDRVKTLVADGTLTGVVDDRGKFIYITEEELKAVAKFINQRGRVPVSELVEYSNKLINLEPDTASSNALQA